MLEEPSIASTGPVRPVSVTEAAPSTVGPSGSSEAAILVAVRVRPFSSKEKALLAKPSTSQFGPTARNFMNYEDPADQDDVGRGPSAKAIRKVVHTIDDHVLVFDPPDENDTSGRRAPVGASNKRHKDIRFVFDRVYGEDSTQRDVYEGTTRGLLDSVMAGYNATVFAYGATGCGKTYTISGCPEDPGVIFLTMQELFERVTSAEDEKTIEVTLSYLEVYNETIRDLLVPDGTVSGALALREDARQSVTVAGLSEHIPHNVDEVMGLMVRGNANRTMSPTEANAVSSRSHAVLQVNIKQKPKSGGLQTDVTSATLSIIDLAGSERATVTRNNGARMREGANINRSLLALANCINALCDQKHKRHIPYRDSKLTRLLKFSLGGNCRTVMITCVSPASTYYEETHNTLKYANRAKNIKTTVAKNTKSTKVHLAQYQGKIREQSEEIKRLQREIAALKNRVSSGAAAANSRSSAQATQAAQAMAELRKQTQAIQVVQDMRNKMSTAYAPVREAKWELSSAQAVGQWYDHYVDSLKGWREQFETLYQEHQHLGHEMEIDGGDGAAGDAVDMQLTKQSLVFRQQVDELLRDLTRERKTIGRHAEHSNQLIERNMYMADRAAQVPPSVQLTAEQRYQVDQEHRVLDLSAERNGLRRRVELGEHIAQDLATQNAMLLRLTATCLCSLKRSIHDVQRIQQRSGSSMSDGAERALEQVYMQAITSFTEATGAVRTSMKSVQEVGGPSKLSFSGSTLTPPSPYVPRSVNAELGGARHNRSPAGGFDSKANGRSAAATASGRQPNAAAISAAVAGTTRARRTANSTTVAAATGRHIRTSPVKRSQAILGRSAVRFSGSSANESGRGPSSPRRLRSATTSGITNGSANARTNGDNHTSSSAAGRVLATAAGRPLRTAGGSVARQTLERSHSDDSDSVVSVGGRSTFAVSQTSLSPRTRKAAQFAANGDSRASSLSATPPQANGSGSSVNGQISPASSVASWASAESSPHHEPLPAAAKPLKGILKSKTAAGGLTRSNSGGGSADEGTAANGVTIVGPGPIRLGSARRKSRQARILTNPTARTTPTKPTTSTRELSFRSLAGAAKKPVWR